MLNAIPTIFSSQDFGTFHRSSAVSHFGLAIIRSQNIEIILVIRKPDIKAGPLQMGNWDGAIVQDLVDVHWFVKHLWCET